VESYGVVLTGLVWLRIDTGGELWGGADWIGMAQDRYRWRAVTNSIMNIWVP
jgi:hypothetical protein